MLHEFRNTTTILHPILHIYAKFSDATAFRGGSIKKSKELKTIMKMVKKISDLQWSAYRLTSVIPSSWPIFEDASSNWSVGHVKKPYAVPVRAAPKCVLQQSIHKWVLKFKSHISFHFCMFIDEPIIYGHYYTKAVIHLEKTLRIYYDHWWQNVTNGPTVTKWVMASRQRFYNALAVEHKCSTSLHINEAYNYKREDNISQRYAQILYEITLNSFSL